MLVPKPLVSVGNCSYVMIWIMLNSIAKDALVNSVTAYSHCVLFGNMTKKKSKKPVTRFKTTTEDFLFMYLSNTFANRVAKSSVTAISARLTNLFPLSFS